METFSALLAIFRVCAENSSATSEFPHKGQWCGALMFPLIGAWINVWANNREVGDLRRHRAHYDVIVMAQIIRGSYFAWIVTNDIYIFKCVIVCNLSVRCTFKNKDLHGTLITSSNMSAGAILVMASANERRSSNVTSPLIVWSHTQNDPLVKLTWYHTMRKKLHKQLFFHSRRQ